MSYSNLVDFLSTAEWLENADLCQVRLSRRETINGSEKRVELTLDVGSNIRPDPMKTLNEVQNPTSRD